MIEERNGMARSLPIQQQSAFLLAQREKEMLDFVDELAAQLLLLGAPFHSFCFIAQQKFIASIT